MNYKHFIIVQLLLFTFSLCEIRVDQKVKLLNGFINYNNNNLPNQNTSDEGSLQNTQQVITSAEQFIAIPPDQPSAPCIRCASHVNPQTAGVSDLANLGIRHLDIHEPSVKHSLDSVLDVKRQVQVVNGVRYILSLSILFDNCSEVDSQDCASSKTCKITILVKPWVKLLNGANYRTILANNCTEEWQYGDNGEFLPEVSPDNHNQMKGNTFVNPNDDDIQTNTEVQSQKNKERSLTDEEVKNLQDQITSNNGFLETTEPNRESVTITTSPDKLNMSKKYVLEVKSAKHSEKPTPLTESVTDDPIKPQYRVLAQESLRKYEQDTGIKQSHNVSRVEKVTTQLVNDVIIIRIVFVASGIQNDVMKCYSKISQQVWLNSKNIKVSCRKGNKRFKRTLPGGVTAQDASEPAYFKLAEESLQKYVQDNGIKQVLRVEVVKKVTTQVVAGSLTKIHFTVSGSQDSNTRECHSEVWDRPWLKEKKKITVNC